MAQVRISANGCDRPGLRDLVNHVLPLVTDQWHYLGLQLLDPKDAHELTIIEADARNDTRTCCRKMFEKWLKTDKLASWDKVIDALALVGLNCAADDVKMLLSLGTVVVNLPRITDNIKSRYRRKGILRYSTEQDPWPPFHSKSFTSLALMHQKVVQAKDNTVKIARIRAKGEIEKIPEITSSVKLNHIHQIFTPITAEDQCPMSFLIEGHPGIGKTTLAKEICLQWANNKLLTSDKLLLLLMLRDPNVQKITSSEELVKYALPTDQAQPVLKYLCTTNGAGVTLIIDGFDELSSTLRQKSYFRHLIEGDNLPNARVVVTSRPSASACLHQYVDRRIEILGFEKSSKEQYIDDVLNTSPSKLQTLKKHLNQYPNIDANCYIPLNLAIIVFLCLLGSLPPTTTEMFASFILHTICRHLKRTGTAAENRCINNMESLPQAIQEAIKKLQKIAFDGLVDDRIVFTMDDLPDVCEDDPTCYGLLQSVECYCSVEVGTTTKSFNFLHLGIQEYFAAKYVASLSNDIVYMLMEQSFLTTNGSSLGSKSVHLSNMWIMYCGITRGQCVPLRRYLSTPTQSWCTLPLSQVPNRLTISQDILKKPVSILYLFQCFQEARDDKLSTILSSSFNSGRINLSACKLLLHQVASLGFFLSRLHKKWNEINLNGCHIGDHGINLLHHYLCGNAANKQEVAIINFSLNSLTKVSSQLIGDIITHLQPHTLGLDGNDIASVRTISTTAIHVRTMKVLHMKSSGLTAQKALAISDIITCFEELHISYNRLGDVGAIKISEGIAKTTTLKVLAISDNNITATGVAAIANSLLHNTSLKVLDISYNAMGQNGAGLIIANSNILQELNVRQCEITATGATIIANSLLQNTSLEELDMSCNAIGQDNIVIGETLNKPSTQKCEQTAAGIRAIANTLQQNTSLKALDISHNVIGEDGTVAVTQIIKNASTLKQLSALCYFTATRATLVANSLLHYTSLETVHISFNTLGQDEAAVIAQAITKSTALKDLSVKVSGRGIDRESAMMIVKSLYYNDSITKLGLSLCVNPYEDSVVREVEHINRRRKICSIQMLDVSYADIRHQHHWTIGSLHYHNDMH